MVGHLAWLVWFVGFVGRFLAADCQQVGLRCPDFPDLWPEAIFMAKLGCPLSFTLETPSLARKLDQRISAHLAAIDVATSLAFKGV